MIKSNCSVAVALLVAFLASSYSMSRDEQLSSDLSIIFKTDKRQYRPHEEIHFFETLKNASTKPMHLFDDTCYSGSDIEITREPDGKKQWEISSSRTHTVKPGMRPSRRVLLQPGETFTREFSAFVTDDYKLAFQDSVGSAFTGFVSGAQSGVGLPSKYVGCGRIFDLGKPGTYKLAAKYLNHGHWSNGGIGPQPSIPEWEGEARSNEVSVTLSSSKTKS